MSPSITRQHLVDPARFVVLDRDGVINVDSPDYIRTPAEWIPIPGSLEAIARLTRERFGIVVITNQSAIGRGLMTESSLEAIHHHMCVAVEEAGGQITAIYHCPHTPEAGCDCRKPKPGLFRRFASDFGVVLDGIPAVGDSLRDLEAAKAAGARPVLVLTGNGHVTHSGLSDTGLEGIETHADLAAFAASLGS